MKYPSISIIVPLYNNEKTIKRCLDSIKNQRYNGRLEIIIVDDNSTDKSLEKVKSLKNIKIIKHTINRGLANSLNEGLKVSIYPSVCIIHADCIIPDKNWLSKLIEEKTDKKIALVNARLVLPSEMLKKTDFWNMVMITNKMNKVLKTGSRYNTVFEKEDSRMVLIDKKIINKFGLFDAKTFKIAGEDTDLILRLTKAGYLIKETNLSLFHMHTFKQNNAWFWLIKKTAPIGEASGVIYRRHKFLINKFWNPLTSTILYLSVFIPYVRIVSVSAIIFISLYYAYNISKYIKNHKVLILPLFKICKDLITIFSFWKGFITNKQEFSGK
ncbi:MAG: glycosyltransferase [archaeon]